MEARARGKTRLRLRPTSYHERVTDVLVLGPEWAGPIANPFSPAAPCRASASASGPI
jgi:hypothetical protein